MYGAHKHYNTNAIGCVYQIIWFCSSIAYHVQRTLFTPVRFVQSLAVCVTYKYIAQWALLLGELNQLISFRFQFLIDQKVQRKMASNTQGIQQLLAAEKKAADKVGEARKRKYKFFFSIHSIHTIWSEKYSWMCEYGTDHVSCTREFFHTTITWLGRTQYIMLVFLFMFAESTTDRFLIKIYDFRFYLIVTNE